MLGSQREYFSSLASVAGEYGTKYWVSPSGNASNDGLSVDRPLLTYAAAIALSNTDVGSNAYHRNTIYLMGGAFDEALTTWADQCDVVGLGRRTAWRALIMGRQNIGQVDAAHLWGIDLYHTAANPLVTLATGSHGWGFHDCIFICGGASPTYGLHVTNTSSGMLEDSRFDGNPPFPTAIYIAGPLFNGCTVRRNIISAEACGIYFHTDVTADYQTVIHNNIIGRMDPNAGDTQLTIGIDLNTDSAENLLLVHNWISAADAIEIHASAVNKASFMCIDNYVVEGTTGNREDKFS